MRTSQFYRSIRQHQRENPQLAQEQEFQRWKKLEEEKKEIFEGLGRAQGNSAGFPPAPIGGGGDGQNYYYPFYVLPGYVAP